MKKLAKLIKSFFLAIAVGLFLVALTLGGTAILAACVVLIERYWITNLNNVIGAIMAAALFGYLWLLTYDHLTGEGDE